jgi:hypothetical protein
MNKLSAVLMIGLIAGGAHAGAIRYYFNGSMAATSGGSGADGLTGSDIAWSISGNNSQLAYYSDNATFTNNVFLVDSADTGTRGSVSAGADGSYFEMSLNIASGYSLNDGFSVNFDPIMFNDITTARERTTYWVWASTDGGANWSSIGGNDSNGFDANPVNGAMAGSVYDLTDNVLIPNTYGARDFNERTVGVNLGNLADGQDVMLRLKIGDSDGDNFYSAWSQISVTGLTTTAIPEPATLGLVVATGTGVMFIRRRIMM